MKEAWNEHFENSFSSQLKGDCMITCNVILHVILSMFLVKNFQIEIIEPKFV